MTKKNPEWRAKRYGTNGMFGARCSVCLYKEKDGGPRLSRGLLRKDPSSNHIWKIHCEAHAAEAGCPARLLKPKAKVHSQEGKATV